MPLFLLVDLSYLNWAKIDMVDRIQTCFHCSHLGEERQMNALFKFQEDYLVGVSNGLDLSCAVGEDGRYEAKLHPELSGLDILGEGSEKVLNINSF